MGRLRRDERRWRLALLSNRVWLSVVGVCGLVGCTDSFDGKGQDTPQANVDSEFEQASNLDDEFARAAADFDVPVQILQAVAYGMTSWQMVEGEVEFEGRSARFGIMGVPEEHLEDLGARLGVSAADVAYDRESNIRAGAMRLTELANGMGIDRADVGAWAPAVALFADIPDEDGRSSFVYMDVYRFLEEGIVSELGTLPPMDVEIDYLETRSGSTGGDGRGAIWRPSPNYSSRPTSSIGEPAMVIIHTCEGSYSGCWSWLTNSSAGVSAHYVVNSDGTEVSQLVAESNKAWHIGASYECDLNSGVDCWRDGYSSNHFTVGIEHAGYSSQSTWHSGLLDRSAKLVCDITRTWGIPIDRYHVVGHGQLQPYNRVDPGPNWPWTDYLARASSACGSSSSSGGSSSGGSSSGGSSSGGSSSGSTSSGGTSTSSSAIEIIIDSNSAANGANAEIEVSSYWTGSNNVSGYYNSGYWWRSTDSSSDLASFWFYLDAPARLTADAWWPSASDRSRNAPFMAIDSNGTTLGTVVVDQHADGQRWVELGTWNFPAGWNRIALSRWTTPGYVVIADAVRVRTAR